MFEILRYGAPVALAACGETLGQRAGVLNIGLEGAMLSSAYAGAIVAIRTQNPWLGLVAGVIVGVVFALLNALFVVKLASDQVVVGTAINLFSLGLTGTLYRAEFGKSGTLLKVPMIPALAPGIDFVTVAMILAVPALTFILFKTKWGLLLRSAGEYPPATVSSGFDVIKIRTQAMLVAGAMAGLAGAYLSVGVSGSFAEGFTNGKGFIAIALVTFGRFRPIWVFAASMLVGAAELAQFWLQAKFGTANVPAEFFIALPYVVALLVLVILGKGTRSPGALGIPFRRNS